MAMPRRRDPQLHPRRRAALVRKSLRKRVPHVARFLDADSFCAHRFGNPGEVGTLEVHAEGDDAGLLLFDLDEVKSIVVEDDLNDWSSSFHLRQEIAKGKHRVAAVATESNRLPPWICHLCAESIGRGVGHGCPSERAEKSPIPAATDMSRQPYDSRSGVSEEKGVISSRIACGFGQEFRTYGLDPGAFINVVLQKTVEGVRFRDVLFEEAPIDFFFRRLCQRIKSGLDVANKTKINSRAAPNMLRLLLTFNFFHFLPP